MIKRPLLGCLLLGVMLSACRGAGPAGPAGEDPYPADGKYFGPAAGSEKTLLTPVPPSDAPVPQPGLASLSGSLFSYTVGKVISETMFYLSPAGGENRDTMPPFLAGPDEARGDITGRSDVYGNFTMDGIPPGSYFLIVSAPYNWCPAENSPEDPAARLIRLAAGDRLALGVVYVSWP